MLEHSRRRSPVPTAAIPETSDPRADTSGARVVDHGRRRNAAGHPPKKRNGNLTTNAMEQSIDQGGAMSSNVSNTVESTANDLNSHRRGRQCAATRGPTTFPGRAHITQARLDRGSGRIGRSRGPESSHRRIMECMKRNQAGIHYLTGLHAQRLDSPCVAAA